MLTESLFCCGKIRFGYGLLTGSSAAFFRKAGEIGALCRHDGATFFMTDISVQMAGFAIR